MRAVQKAVQHHKLHTNRHTDSHTLLNPLNAELNPICPLLALVGAHHIHHVSRIRVKGVNGFIPTLSVFLDRCGLNSVQEIPTQCQLAVLSLVKIDGKKIYRTEGGR